MDFLRSGYRARMQTFTEGEPPVEVVWFRVPEDRPVFEAPTPFRSLNWVAPVENDGLGEQRPYLGECSTGSNWYRGMAPAPYTGSHACGSLDTWRDGGDANTPRILTLPDGRCADCAEPNQVAMGGTAEGSYDRPCPAVALRGNPYFNPSGRIFINFPDAVPGDLVVIAILGGSDFITPIPPLLPGFTPIGTYESGLFAWRVGYRKLLPGDPNYWDMGPTDFLWTCLAAKVPAGEWAVMSPVSNSVDVPGYLPALPCYDGWYVSLGLYQTWETDPGPWNSLQGYELSLNVGPFRQAQWIAANVLAGPGTPERLQDVVAPVRSSGLQVLVRVPGCINQWAIYASTGSGGEGDGGTARIVQVGSGGELDGGAATQAGNSEQVGSGGELDGGLAVQASSAGQVGSGGELDGGAATQAGAWEQVGSGGELDSGTATQASSAGQAGSGGELDGGVALQSPTYIQVGSGGELDGGTAAQVQAHNQTGTGGELDGGVALQSPTYIQVGSGGELDGGTAAQLQAHSQAGAGGELDGGTATQSGGGGAPTLVGYATLASSSGGGAITVPAGTMSSDYVQVWQWNSEYVAPSDPTGWLAANQISQGVNTGLGGWWLSAWDGGGLVAGDTVLLSAGGFAATAAIMVVFRGAAFVAADAQSSSGTGGGASAPAVFSPASGSLVVAGFGVNQPSGLAVSAPLTLIVAVTNGSFTAQLAVGWTTATGSGLTGPFSASSTFATFWGAGTIVSN